jgi:hypothetical protein
MLEPIVDAGVGDAVAVGYDGATVMVVVTPIGINHNIAAGHHILRIFQNHPLIAIGTDDFGAAIHHTRLAINRTGILVVAGLGVVVARRRLIDIALGLVGPIAAGILINIAEGLWRLVNAGRRIVVLLVGRGIGELNAGVWPADRHAEAGAITFTLEDHFGLGGRGAQPDRRRGQNRGDGAERERSRCHRFVPVMK